MAFPKVKPRLSVAVVSHFPPPPGGMPDQAELLVRLLRGEGVRALPVRTNLGPGRFAAWLDGVRGLRTLLRLPQFLIRLLLRLPKARAIHVFSHSGLGFLLFTVPSVLIGRLARRRVVVNYHGGGADVFFGRFGVIGRPILRYAHAVLVPSGYLQEIFSRHGISTAVVPVVCDLARFAWRGDEPRQPVFIVARHLEAIYNVACCLRAFARIRREVPDARLIVLGGGREARTLRRLARDLGVGDTVEFTGYVPNRNVPAQFERASIFLNSSRVDNVPVSVLEAFAAGLPVVSTTAGGIPHLVEDGRTGLLVSVDDDAALAERALDLLRDPELARRISRAAREALAAHDWPRIYARLRDAYGVDSGCRP